MKQNTLTVMIDTEVPVADWMGVEGPAVVVLSKFDHTVYKSSDLLLLPRAHSALNTVGLRPGAGKSGRLLTDDESAALLDVLNGDENVMRIARQLFIMGRVMINTKPYPKGAPILDEKRGLVRKNTQIRRMHTLFYNPEVDAFTVPPVEDRRIGSPFYFSDADTRVGVNTIKRRCGKAVSDLYRWSKRSWRRINKLAKAGEVVKAPVNFGTPMFEPTPHSHFKREYIDGLVLEYARSAAVEAKRMVPMTVDDVKVTSEYGDMFNQAYVDLVDSHKPMPRTAFQKIIDETFVEFKVNADFQPRVVENQKLLQPAVHLFSDLPQGSKDRTVFNGMTLPFV